MDGAWAHPSAGESNTLAKSLSWSNIDIYSTDWSVSRELGTEQDRYAAGVRVFQWRRGRGSSISAEAFKAGIRNSRHFGYSSYWLVYNLLLACRPDLLCSSQCLRESELPFLRQARRCSSSFIGLDTS